MVALTVVTGCTTQTPAPSTVGAGILPDSTVGPLIEALPARTITALPTARLADGLIPPTNKWFSGLVFGDDPLPVFPLPLAFQMTEQGFAFGVPAIVTNDNVIAGGFFGALTADIGADDYAVSAYDEASVTIANTADGIEIGTTVIAEGSPFVSFTATKSVTVDLGQSLTAGTGAWTITIDGTEYGLVSDGAMAASTTVLTLSPGQVATWFAVSTGGSLADYVTAAASPIMSTSIHYSVANDRTTTSITYETTDGSPTIVAAMPHQYASLGASTVCETSSWKSVYGQLLACAGTELTWSVPTVTPAGSIDLSQFSDDNKFRLVAQLTIDVASTLPAPADTYYGGKWMYRLTNMLDIARQLGADDLATTITDQLVNAMDGWADPDGCTNRTERCFVYDEQARGIVGLAPSFGSDQFNDHHFHYGYFLYTAGVLAAADPTLVTRWAPVMNLLAADIAAQSDNTYFPERRVFDAYAGHSWASGTAPFADGNNQESSSEAVSAWNGLALWAAASNQPDLATEAQWMLSAEAESALAYWTNFDRSDAVYDGFGHTVASLNWGGKRDYATWFSAEPSAMLGILVLPMSPVAGYLGIDPDRVRANLSEAAPQGSDVLFGDYLLMYSALAGSEDAAAALDESANLTEDRIDDGNSRSYMLAWIMSKL
ncbi:glycosyl hydrolase [Salinibacterium sp. TMP30]|uniref:glycosyl hydrolase n=1 Tax=Salinibacterium sp. TMP30 TaxID=3138237 RepID=UPI00313940A4